MDKNSAWFNDPQLRARFEQLGYVVVDALGQEALASLRALGAQLAPYHRTPFHSSIFTADQDYRDLVTRHVEAAFGQAVERLFSDALMVFSGYVTKQNDRASLVAFHQDWSFVDESRYDAVTLWAPLVDVDTRNGCLLVVPGSHKLNRQARGYNSEFPYPDLIPELLRKYTVAVPLRAGQAIIFSQRLFHASNPNLSNQVRLCVNTLVVPRAAQLQFNYLHGEGSALAGMIESFAVDKAWYQHYQWGSRPDSERRLSLRANRWDQVGAADLAALPEFAPLAA